MARGHFNLFAPCFSSHVHLLLSQPVNAPQRRGSIAPWWPDSRTNISPASFIIFLSLCINHFFSRLIFVSPTSIFPSGDPEDANLHYDVEKKEAVSLFSRRRKQLRQSRPGSGLFQSPDVAGGVCASIFERGGTENQPPAPPPIRGSPAVVLLCHKYPSTLHQIPGGPGVVR